MTDSCTTLGIPRRYRTLVRPEVPEALAVAVEAHLPEGSHRFRRRARSRSDRWVNQGLIDNEYGDEASR